MKILNKKTILTALMMLGCYNIASAETSDKTEQKCAPKAITDVATTTENRSTSDTAVNPESKTMLPF